MNSKPKVETALEACQIEDLHAMTPERGSSEEFWKLVGRQEAFTEVSVFSTLSWAENLFRLKESKHYQKLGLSWAETIARFTPFSVDTADRMATAFGEFGKRFFEVRSLVRLSAQAYRQLNPGFTDDGKIIIGGEAYALTKANASAIQAAIEASNQQLAERSAEVSRAKAVATKAKEQADNAKKAVERKDEELQALKKKDSEFFKHVEDADHITIIQAHSQFEMVLRKLENLEAADLSPMNVGRLLGMIQYQRCALEQTYARLAEAKGLGDIAEFPVDPEFIESCYVGQRNVMAEYLTERKIKEAQ
jgi:hypothetical protein